MSAGIRLEDPETVECCQLGRGILHILYVMMCGVARTDFRTSGGNNLKILARSLEVSPEDDESS